MIRFVALFLVLLAAIGVALGVCLVRWAERCTDREFYHRLAMLSLLVLTVVSVAAAALVEFPFGTQMYMAERGAEAFLAGMLVLLWTYWLRADRKHSRSRT